MNYIINFVLILLKNTPPILRLNPFRAFMELFGRGLNHINEEYVFLISHTGQVCSLEHYLNTVYGIPYSIQTRDADIDAQSIIYIDEVMIQKTHVYNKIELRPPIWLYPKYTNKPVYLHNKSEQNDYEFVINVPGSFAPFSEPLLRAHANKYVIAGKRYIVQTY